jgi:hypothetical protein
MGCYVILNDAIRIMIPRDLHIGNEEFESVEVGDRIKIEIKKSRYQVNDTHILSIGQFIGRVGAGPAPAPAPAPALAPSPSSPVLRTMEEGEESKEDSEDAADLEESEGKEVE